MKFQINKFLVPYENYMHQTVPNILLNGLYKSLQIRYLFSQLLLNASQMNMFTAFIQMDLKQICNK